MKFRDYTEIIFEAGNILSAQMLEETYRYPREFLHLTHAGYCDGILTGLDFIEKKDGVYLTAGLVKIDGKYYVLPQDVNIDEWLKKCKPPLQPQVVYSLYIVNEDFLSADDKACGIKTHSRVMLKAMREELPNKSLLLARYKFRPDAKISLPQLNNEKNPFEEFFQSGLLQLTECIYAHQSGEPTFHPLIFRAFQKYLEQKFPLSPYDFSLLTELQNHGTVSTKSLITYVKVVKDDSDISPDITREKLLMKVSESIQKPYTPRMACVTTSEQPGRNTAKSRRPNKLID